jgi:MFS family permease
VTETASQAPEKVEANAGSSEANVKYSFLDGAFYSLMVGFGETYLPAFLLASGMSQIRAGIITTGPLLVGALIQYFALPLNLKIKSPRRLVVGCALTQSAIFVPFMLFAYFEKIPWLFVFGLACVYWGCALAASPRWNEWVDKIVEAKMRPRFFALRGRICQFFILLGLVGSGLILDYGRAHNQELLSYAVVFGIACMARLISAVFLRMQGLPTHNRREPRIIPLRAFLTKLGSSSDGKFIFYMMLVYLAAYVAAPFFTPFMLAQLELSYQDYILLISASFLGKASAFPLLGRFSIRFGVNRLMLVSGILITPLAAMWVFSDNFYYLLVIQLCSGVLWAGFELSTTLMVFERIELHERSSMLTYMNLLQMGAQAAGSLLGGVVLFHFEQSYLGYMVIFFGSSVLRVLTILPLFRATEIRVNYRFTAFRTLGLRSTGAILRPIESSRVFIRSRRLKKKKPPN